MNYEGTVHQVNDTQQISEKFKKRTIVLTDEAASYPNFIEFVFTQKNVDMLDGIKKGDKVDITFTLKGRQWKDKFFNELSAFRIKSVGASNETFTPEPDSDLPF